MMGGENKPFFQIGYKTRECVMITPKGWYGHGAPDDLDWIAVDVQALAGRFEGNVSDYLSISDLTAFCTQLEKMHQTLKGRAVLGSMDTRFQAELYGDGLGHIAAHATVSDDLAELKCTIEIDQTFLPKMIGEVKHILGTYTHP